MCMNFQNVLFGYYNPNYFDLFELENDSERFSLLGTQKRLWLDYHPGAPNCILTRRQVRWINSQMPEKLELWRFSNLGEIFTNKNRAIWKSSFGYTQGTASAWDGLWCINLYWHSFSPQTGYFWFLFYIWVQSPGPETSSQQKYWI